ncbi:hypothetical protein B0H13DRAFT_2092663 [Mycena leptocephala]|nr:hypothetical protein B0H13DRAFT_2092663 [Mycena leptocephala]
MSHLLLVLSLHLLRPTWPFWSRSPYLVFYWSIQVPGPCIFGFLQNHWDATLHKSSMPPSMPPTSSRRSSSSLQNILEALVLNSCSFLHTAALLHQVPVPQKPQTECPMAFVLRVKSLCPGFRCHGDAMDSASASHIRV